MPEMRTWTAGDTTYEIVDTQARNHINNTNNPHNTTAAQIGAAPDGYGLGVLGATMPALLDLDSATKIGWYYINTDTANNPLAVGGVVEVQSSSANNLVQTLVSSTASKLYGVKLQRVRLQGEWEEWEWINPPMISGTEYRTTERWNGKAVYTKLVDCKSWASNGNVDTGVPYGGKVIRYSGTIDNIPLPTIDASMESTWSAWVQFGTNSSNFTINMRGGSGWAGRQTYVQMWYTKD